MGTGTLLMNLGTALIVLGVVILAVAGIVYILLQFMESLDD